jgi:AraC-like DNA-binding protein
MPSVRFALPAPSLRRFITAYYFVDIPVQCGPLEDLLHPEWANIRFTLSGRWSTRIGGVDHDPAPPAALFGPTSAAGLVRGEGGVVLGVGLLPLGWARFIAAPASQMADKVAPLADMVGERAEEALAALRQATDDAACVAILDALFGALDADGPPLEPVLLKAHAQLLDPAIDTVSALAGALALSPRHLTRLSLRMFGFAPKLLIRRQRFLRTLQSLRERPDAALGDLIDDGYFDQSHFTRDFHLFMGMSPSAYFALPHVLLGPAARERMAALGTSYQGLHAKLR